MSSIWLRLRLFPRGLQSALLQHDTTHQVFTSSYYRCCCFDCHVHKKRKNGRRFFLPSTAAAVATDACLMTRNSEMKFENHTNTVLELRADAVRRWNCKKRRAERKHWARKILNAWLLFLIWKLFLAALANLFSPLGMTAWQKACNPLEC